MPIRNETQVEFQSSFQTGSMYKNDKRYENLQETGGKAPRILGIGTTWNDTLHGPPFHRRMRILKSKIPAPSKNRTPFVQYVDPIGFIKNNKQW
jgi:hypothetical protein